MFYTDIVLYFFTVVSFVEAAHFGGGSISWQVVSPTLTNTTAVTINIEQTYSWAYSSYPCGPMIGGANNIICISSNCSNYNSTLVGTQTPCINFDPSFNLSTGHSSTPITLTVGAQLVLAYNGTSWLQLVSGSSASWSLVTSIDLRVRVDNGQINSAPTASMPGMITVPTGIQQTLRVPMADADFDIVKCRWANSTAIVDSTVIDECGGVCQNIPTAQLYSSLNTNNNCTIVFNSTSAGYYVAALQIEDFMPSAPNGLPLSSISLQFLILILNTSCSQPTIIGQLPNGATIGVEANKVFTMSVYAEPGCNTTFIDHFSTIAQPSGVVNISTAIPLGSMLYSIEFTWTPTLNLIGSTQIYCTMATDSNNLESIQYCLNFIILGSTTIGSTTTTTQVVITTPTTNNISLVLGLGLSLALLLILTSVLLCGCCCWHPGFCWKKPKQELCEEQNAVRQQIQSSQLDQAFVYNTSEVHENSAASFQPKYSNNIPTAPTHQPLDDFSGDYLQQNVKNNAVTLTKPLSSLSDIMPQIAPQINNPM